MKKTSIIILHGWGLSGKKFDVLSKELKSKGYLVYAPDLPGFGESKAPPFAYHLSDYADFLSEFIQKNNLVDPVLIGHSFGGRVSLKFLHSHPNGALAVIFTGTPGYTPVPRRRLQLFVLIAKVGKGLFSLWPLSVLQEKIRAWYYYLVGARDFYRANPMMREIFKFIVQEELTLPIASIRIPCALIWGSLDQITPVWIAKKMHDAITNSSLTIIEDADHGVSYKKPKEFSEYVDTFLKSL